MMHTYLKQSEDRYDIGQWLINHDGHHQFVALFTVANLKRAFVAVNHLNGGTRMAIEALQLEEKD